MPPTNPPPPSTDFIIRGTDGYFDTAVQALNSLYVVLGQVGDRLGILTEDGDPFDLAMRDITDAMIHLRVHQGRVNDAVKGT